MNKVMNTKELLGAISFIPETAPFDGEQRAWLNGFFAGLTGIEEVAGIAAGNTGLAGGVAGLVAEPEVEEEEDFPWHDDAIEIDQRMELAKDRPHDRKLMAAMAQLDCGSCGYLCQTYAEAIATGEESNLTLCSPGGKETARMLKKLVKEVSAGASAKPSSAGATATTTDEAGYSRKNPYPAKLIKSVKLTGDGSAKDVRHVEIDLSSSDLSYDVGDALGVYPTNCPELVDEVLGCCHTNGQVDRTRESLMVKDLSTATDELMEALIERSSGALKNSFEKLAADDDQLDEVDVLDVLAMADQKILADTDLVEALPDLNARLYSIASSLRRHQGQVHLTVGRVAYEKNGRIRKGVASTMFSDRVAPDSEVRVFVQAAHGFTVPQSGDTPMIMVGPGTGIAPFVSFLQEREAVGAKGDNWLFFGDQKSETDFLYADQLTEYQENGLLTRLDTAFSRDQAHKIYVQDRMRENGAEIFKWLQAGGHFYVCGDASRMAKDVDKALHDVIAEHGQMSEDEAKNYVKNLSAENRYCRDVY